MDGWQTFSSYFRGIASQYTQVSEEYADYCSDMCDDGPALVVPIGDLIKALEGMIQRGNTRSLGTYTITRQH